MWTISHEVFEVGGKATGADGRGWGLKWRFLYELIQPGEGTAYGYALAHETGSL